MRVRIILLISIVLNVVLASAFVAWRNSPPRANTNLVRATPPTLSTSMTLRIVKTNILIRPRTFAWQEVETPDYPTYIENLRELGMPESTIRDIIVADVDQLYLRKRREEAARYDVEWWRTQPSAEYQSNLTARAEALETERSALLARLLGDDWREGRLDQQPDPLPLAGPVLSALPEEVKRTVQDIAAQSGERLRAYLREQSEKGEAVNELEMARLRENTRLQLAAVLSPQQLEEFLLRFSENANRLRRELGGIELAPDEFRRAFRLIDQIDRDLQLRYSGNDPAAQRQRQVLEQQRMAALYNALGGERFEAYRMLHDPLYHETVASAQQDGASPEAATALYEIARATSEEVARIRTDPSLTAAQREQQLRETETEQQRARALVLGQETGAPDSGTATPAVPALRTHVLEPGETMGRLALRYGVRISALREANPGLDINRLPPGAVVNVPPSQPPPLPPMPPRTR